MVGYEDNEETKGRIKRVLVAPMGPQFEATLMTPAGGAGAGAGVLAGFWLDVVVVKFLAAAKLGAGDCDGSFCKIKL